MPKISAYPAGGSIQATDNFVIARAGANYKVQGSSFVPAAGYMHNGFIQPSVAGNNLTLSLVTLAGTNPSATDPVYIRIGGLWRAVTAALTVTAAAATNWFNSGSAELATQEVDYFAYIGFNAVDGVVLGFSRIPYANIYSDFSATSTNERYCRISTILNAAATDQYAVIGRFTAKLSAGAGYTWTAVASTYANLIQYPIFYTRLLTWAPVITYSGGANNPTSNVVSIARYQLSNFQMMFQIQSLLTRGAGNRTSTIFSLPWTTPSITPYACTDQITAAGIKNAAASYTSTNTAIVVETMAADGFYFLKGIFPLI